MSGQHPDRDAPGERIDASAGDEGVSEETPGGAPETHVAESDPNADSPDGLGGGMGISSERKGPVRGLTEEATHGAAAFPDAEEGPPPVDPVLEGTQPEKTAGDDVPEENPPSPGSHRSDPEANPGHGV